MNEYNNDTSVIIPKKDYIAPEDYFLIEEQAEYKSEYERGKIINMSGASLSHERICRTLTSLLFHGLSESDCEVFPSNLKIEVLDKQKYYYPDVSVVCGEVELVENRDDIITNPILIVEVLSRSSLCRDRVEKREAYMNLPSLKDYIIIDQYRPYVEIYHLQSPKTWLLTIYDQMEECLYLPILDVKLTMEQIYLGVEF